MYVVLFLTLGISVNMYEWYEADQRKVKVEMPDL